MTVLNTTARVPYTGDGVSTAFTIPFKFITNADIAVYVAGVLQSTGVTITGGGGTTGTATFAVAPANLASVVLVRAQINDQQASLPSNGPFPAHAVETMVDKAMIGIQQVNDLAQLALRAATGDTSTLAALPPSASRANKFLAFDALGQPVASSGTGADAGLRTDLAASGGSALVAFLPSGTGAVARTVQARLRDTVSVFDFMSTAQIADVQAGTAVLNVTAAIQAAIDSIGSNGGRLYFPPGVYAVSDIDSDGACLKIQYPIQLAGAGPFYTAIRPLASVSSAVHTLWFSPSTSFDARHTSVEGLFLGNPFNGTRQGNAGVYCSTLTAGQSLPQFSLRGCYVGQGSGPAFYHLNSAVNNPDGGMYGAVIERNTLTGGARFDFTGDSNSVNRNLLSGTGIGLQASLVTGSSLLEVMANNITATYGAIRLLNGSRFRVIGNNCEQSAALTVANNDSAVISINGSGGTMYGGVLKENLISGFGATDATACVKLDNCRGVLVEDNVILSGAAGLTTGIVNGGSSQDVRLGANTYNAGITTKVTDTGVGTMGILKTTTLQNSWVAYAAGTQTLKYIKDSDGFVQISGTIKNGVTANNTILAVLPAGFRPAETIRDEGTFLTGGVPTKCEVNVDTGGNVTINYVTASTQLNVNLTFMASNLADAVSLE